MNIATIENTASLPVPRPPKRGRPKSEVTIKTLRAEIVALGAKPYGKDCAKLNKADLLAYVAQLKAAKAAH